MPNRIFFFSDIDDTLIQTRRKTDFEQSTIVGGYTKEGVENSFFYEGTKLFIDTLMDAKITFIPTTARNRDSYQRTIFADDKRIKYVILNFGAMVLIDGEIDEKWQSHIQKAYAQIISIEKLNHLLLDAFKATEVELVVKIIDNFYISIYNKFNLDDKGVLTEVKEILEQFLKEHNDFYLYENDNSFALLPNFLNKKFAVKYLMDTHKPILTLGAGDNSTDLDFMDLTSFRIVPQKVAISLRGDDID